LSNEVPFAPDNFVKIDIVKIDIARRISKPTGLSSWKMSTNNSTSGRGGNSLQNRNSQRSTLLKVVILGDGGVGKSCLMNRFVSNHFDEHSFHTIGVEFLNKDIEINGEAYTLQIWDTAGQERFKTLRTPFYRGSDICLLTYAVDDRTSFRNLALWRSEFLKYADVQEGSTFPFIVVGNKVYYRDQDKQNFYYTSNRIYHVV